MKDDSKSLHPSSFILHPSSIPKGCVMLLRSARARRRGTVLPLVALCIVALLGLVALAVDVGLMMVARNQCQNAADSAATAAARALNGDVSNNNNYAAAGPAGVA